MSYILCRTNMIITTKLLLFYCQTTVLMSANSGTELSMHLTPVGFLRMYVISIENIFCARPSYDAFKSQAV